MNSKGIRIYVKQSETVRIELPDILREVHDGERFQWSIQEIEASGHLGEGRTYQQLEKEINESIDGFSITWNELNALSEKFDQVIWITIIGCKDEKLLRCYEDDQEMYATCDLVVVVFDGWFLEVFSKDIDLIDRLAAKFNKIELLEAHLKCVKDESPETSS